MVVHGKVGHTAACNKFYAATSLLMMTRHPVSFLFWIHN